MEYWNIGVMNDKTKIAAICNSFPSNNYLDWKKVNKG